MRRARGDDILLLSAGLAFYALVSIVPLVILILWIGSLVLGDDRMRGLADTLGRVAPKELGADQAVRRVVELGTSLGLTAIVTGLWPATAYGGGLVRAFDRLSSRRSGGGKGFRGRGLLFLVLLPMFVVGSIVSAYAVTSLFDNGGLDRLLGVAVALVVGAGAALGTLVVVYRLFPPEPLGWITALRAAAGVLAGVALLSLGFAVYVAFGANFEQHYGASGIAGLVLLGVWLFLANALVLVGYRGAVEG